MSYVQCVDEVIGLDTAEMVPSLMVAAAQQTEVPLVNWSQPW